MGLAEEAPAPFREVRWEQRASNFCVDQHLSQYGVFNDQLFRLISLERFKRELTHGEIRFSDPEEWVDPYERLWIQRFRNSVDGVKARILCLTKQSHSEALWKVYRRHPQERFVRYQISFSALLAQIESWEDAKNWKTYCAAVQYGERSQLENVQFKLEAEKKVSRKLAGAYSYKLRAFSYEDELRLVLTTQTAIDEGAMGFKVDWSCLLKKVLIDPIATESQAASIEDELTELLPSEVEVRKSDLYIHSAVNPLTPRPINSICPRTGIPVSRTATSEYRGLTVGFSNDLVRDEFINYPNEADKRYFDVLIQEYGLID